MTRSETSSIHTSKKSLISVGRYQMLKVLGKGNFARVEEAVHTLLNVKVAIKVIDTVAIQEDYVIRNLTREARLLSKLRHPSIVRLYETIQCGSVYYLVIELATGGDLYTHIKNQPLGRLDEKTSKVYGRQLVAALEHMHARGIVHRDLKMENIMLQDARKERIKIVDFGLSNMYTRDNPLKTHCGSPEYAAPELFVVGKRYGPEVDLWSLGVVFYAMATGQLPFQSPRDGQTSSEERRRKLLAQINRGLTTTQKKNIAAMSSEYRNLVNRLLMPVAHKRITIQELCFHPWIANKQKNVTSKLSQTDLVALEHNAIIDEIAEVTNTERSIVERDILQAKYGEIGGMYNIKAHILRQGGSLHAFQARSWTTTFHPSRNLNVQSAHFTSNSRTRPSPVSMRTRSGLQPITTTPAQRRTMVFHRSLPTKPASSGGGCGGGTWTHKKTRAAASSHVERQSACPVRCSNDQALGTSPEVPGSAVHAKWESNSDRVHAHLISKASNKSIGASVTRPPTRIPSHQIRTSPAIRPAQQRPEVMVHRDPVEQWITEKLKNLEKQDRSRLRQTQHRPSSNVLTEANRDVRDARVSPPTIQTLCKDIRSDQPAAIGQGDRVTERWFYRSPALRPEVRKTRFSFSSTTKNSRDSRPMTAIENCKQSPTDSCQMLKSSNKLRWMERLRLVRSVSADQCNDSGLEYSWEKRKSVFILRGGSPRAEVRRYQSPLRDFPV